MADKTKLAQMLKDAGFPQKESDMYTSDGQFIPEEKRIYLPSCDEIIEEMGADFYSLERFAGNQWTGVRWTVTKSPIMYDGRWINETFFADTRFEALTLAYLRTKSNEKFYKKLGRIK